MRHTNYKTTDKEGSWVLGSWEWGLGTGVIGNQKSKKPDRFRPSFLLHQQQNKEQYESRTLNHPSTSLLTQFSTYNTHQGVIEIVH